ncbi:putative phage-type endonuclease [Lachnospiraceae bacterium XBB2008]|nr:putative phage-type endonuclease [Lachnospiraceae bacterium XBB2008]
MYEFDRIPLEGIKESEWQALRKTGIGGSDAGAIVGVNPYRSPMSVYYDKTTDTVEMIDNESVRVGKDLEQYVAIRFFEATGKKVRKSNYMYRSKAHPFMIADVDRLVVGEEAGLECKTCNAYKASEWANGAVPPSYLLQSFHYMAVTGKKTWYIACLIMGKEFVYRTIRWDDAVISALIDTETRFWEGHVIPHIPPEPDGTESCGNAIAQLFPVARQVEPIELKDMELTLERRDQIQSQIEELQQEQALLDQQIKLAMEDHEQAVSGRFRVSWGNVESTRLDTKRIKEENPDMYQQYCKKSVSRRFSIKVA